METTALTPNEEEKKRLKEERAERLRQAYKDSGLTYDKLAEMLDVSRNTLANWLTRPARRVPPEYVVKMVEEKVYKERLDNPERK